MKNKRVLLLCSVVLSLAVPAVAQVSASASAVSEAVNASVQKPPVAAIADETVSPASLKARYPAKSIVSVEQANRALKDVQKGQERIEALFKADEKACYKTFFANRCVAEAKERRRIALTNLKPIRVEADSFKRHDAVVRRDKALEERRLKEARTVRPDPNVDKRAEGFQAKHQEAQKKELSATGKSAENEAIFAKKAKDREAAQRKVVEKRAKTEKRRKSKADASAAAAANRPQPSSPASAPASTAK